MRLYCSIFCLLILAPLAGTAAIDVEAAKGHWAYQPLANAAVPAVIDHRWPRGEIDRFLLAGMEAAGLRPAADATTQALLRRACFDLTGLPPTPEQVVTFQSRVESLGREAAFHELVDHLLDSPAYGERWGRHWLDLVRYADTSGSSSDHPVPEVRLYRDYVIAALNADKPYDQFVCEQLAGDLLPFVSEEQRREQIIATGYLAGARRFGVSGKEMHLTIEDAINNLGDALLATSIGCARCHDHMHDPVPTADYYALYGIFESSRFPFPGSENQKTPSDFVVLSGGDAERRQLEGKLARLERERDSLKRQKRDGVEPDDYTAQLEVLEDALREVRGQLAGSRDLAYAMADASETGAARIHLQGDRGRSGEEVQRGFLQVLGGQKLPADAAGSGRLELARWISARDNALFARVIVNRVWALHFGRGLVNTPNDFGSHGDVPSHPALLDHLAAGFIADGYSLKNLHRRIMRSRAYGLSSESMSTNNEIDPEAVQRWRFQRRRLSAEEIRDSMLAVSGELDRSPGGAHPFPPKEKWRFTQHAPFYATYDHDQRSIYLMQQRIRRHPVLSVFDGADTTSSTPQRAETNSPVQSLFLMNSPFAHDMAAAFAGRLLTGASTEVGRIRLAHYLILGRDAIEEDIKFAQHYLEQLRATLAASSNDPDPVTGAKALASYARVLFCSNEFLYVD